MLRKLDYGEADRIYTLLTRDHGKVGAIGKGVRKTSSKLASSLELFSQVEVLLAHGRNLDVITQVQRVETPRMVADIGRTAYAGVVAELAERMSEDRNPIERLFELTCRALNELAVEAEPRRAAHIYLAAALDLMGYTPQLAVCARCERILEPVAAPFSPSAGGFLCQRCGDPAAPVVDVAAIKVLRVLFSGETALHRRLVLTPAIMDAVEDVLFDQLEYHLDRRLKSLGFLRRMRGVA